jgi:hypothetical protein
MKQFGKIKFLILGFLLVAVVFSFIPRLRVTAAVPPGPTIAADNPAAFPFETNICLDDASGATCSAEATALGWPMPSTFTVPTTTSGKTVGRLVINYVSGICYDAYLGVFLVTPLSENEVNGVKVAHNLFTGLQIAGGSDLLIQQPTTIYVDPGAKVTLFVNQWVTTGGACFLNVNGDLVTD